MLEGLSRCLHEHWLGLAQESGGISQLRFVVSRCVRWTSLLVTVALGVDTRGRSEEKTM